MQLLLFTACKHKDIIVRKACVQIFIRLIKDWCGRPQTEEMLPGFQSFIIENFATHCCLYSVLEKSFEFRDTNTALVDHTDQGSAGALLQSITAPNSTIHVSDSMREIVANEEASFGKILLKVHISFQVELEIWLHVGKDGLVKQAKKKCEVLISFFGIFFWTVLTV